MIAQQTALRHVHNTMCRPIRCGRVQSVVQSAIGLGCQNPAQSHITLNQMHHLRKATETN